MRAEEIVMRIHAQWKELFITVPALLAVFLLVVPTNRVGATGPSIPLFLPAIAYDSGGYEAFSVAVADVNVDGKADLVVANSFACPYPSCSIGNVGVLVGNGDGTFLPAVSYSSGGFEAISVAVADVNGDGKPDLIVTNHCLSGESCLNGTVGVLLGNGDGTFQAVVTYDSGGYGPTSVVVGDVNGDGKPDLLLANQLCGSTSTGCVGILLGNGNGTFQTATPNGSGLEYGYSVAVADVNGDGKPDLVVGSTCISYPYNCTDLVGVLLGNGDGTFQPVVTYNSGEGYESSVVVADVNGDGKPDLLSANLDSNTIGVLLGNGDGTFQPVASYDSSGTYARSVAIADVDGDGKPDLVVAIGFDGTGLNGSVGVLLGNGDGTFQPVVAYGSGGVETMFSVNAIDVNGDGRPDVVTSLCAVGHACGSPVDGAVGVLLNNTPFCTTPPVITLSATPTSLWPPNGKMVPVTVSGTVIDSGTGCTVKTAAYAVTDEYGEVQPSGPLTLGPSGAYSFTILLRASRFGADIDGRLYTVNVSASNSANKTGSQSGTVIVPHDQGH
jgi:hypothetical protein